MSEEDSLSEYIVGGVIPGATIIPSTACEQMDWDELLFMYDLGVNYDYVRSKDIPFYMEDSPIGYKTLYQEEYWPKFESMRESITENADHLFPEFQDQKDIPKPIGWYYAMIPKSSIEFNVDGFYYQPEASGELEKILTDHNPDLKTGESRNVRLPSVKPYDEDVDEDEMYPFVIGKLYKFNSTDDRMLFVKAYSYYATHGNFNEFKKDTEYDDLVYSYDETPKSINIFKRDYQSADQDESKYAMLNRCTDVKYAMLSKNESILSPQQSRPLDGPYLLTLIMFLIELKFMKYFPLPAVESFTNWLNPDVQIGGLEIPSPLNTTHYRATMMQADKILKPIGRIIPERVSKKNPDAYNTPATLVPYELHKLLNMSTSSSISLTETEQTGLNIHRQREQVIPRQREQVIPRQREQVIPHQRSVFDIEYPTEQLTPQIHPNQYFTQRNLSDPYIEIEKMAELQQMIPGLSGMNEFNQMTIGSRTMTRRRSLPYLGDVPLALIGKKIKLEGKPVFNVIVQHRESDIIHDIKFASLKKELAEKKQKEILVCFKKHGCPLCNSLGHKEKKCKVYVKRGDYYMRPDVDYKKIQTYNEVVAFVVNDYMKKRVKKIIMVPRFDAKAIHKAHSKLLESGTDYFAYAFLVDVNFETGIQNCPPIDTNIISYYEMTGHKLFK